MNKSESVKRIAAFFSLCAEVLDERGGRGRDEEGEKFAGSSFVGLIKERTEGDFRRNSSTAHCK